MSQFSHKTIFEITNLLTFKLAQTCHVSPLSRRGIVPFLNRKEPRTCVVSPVDCSTFAHAKWKTSGIANGMWAVARARVGGKTWGRETDRDRKRSSFENSDGGTFIKVQRSTCSLLRTYFSIRWWRSCAKEESTVLTLYEAYYVVRPI